MDDASARFTPRMPVSEVHRRLTAPGAPFEMAEALVHGVPMRVWKNGPQTLLDIFRQSQTFPDREFLLFEDQRVTFSAFGAAVCRLAANLKERGVAKGDVIAIVAPNAPEWPVAYMATALVGAIAAAINPMFQQPALKAALDLCGAVAVVCDKDRVEKIRTCGAAPSKWLIRFGEPAAGAADRLEDIIGPPSMWSDLPAIGLPQTPIDPEDDAAIFFTSGTMGEAKGVVCSHRANAYSLFHAAFRNARRFQLSGETPPDPDFRKAPQQVTMMALPFFHVSALNAVIPMLWRGGKLVLHRWWSPERALKTIAAEKVNIVAGVPTIATQIVEHRERKSHDLSSLEQVIYGGAPSPHQLPSQIAAAGATPGQNWGMTETAGALIGVIGPEFVADPDGCGLPSAVHDVEIRDANGRPVPAGDVGELWVKGPQITRGYWRSASETAEAIVNGWLKTGDMARLDADGRCRIVDRLKDLIICGGENIYCGEIEAAIAAHPDVDEVAAFGMPHHAFGEQPAAVVVARPGAVVTEQDIRIFAGRALTPNKIPARVVISAERLPRNDAGKVLKKTLRAAYAG